MRILPAAAICLVVLASQGARAQEPGRYSLERTADGYVRMDRRTGAMSVCNEASGQLVCRVAADERKAYEDGIAALEERLATVEKRLDALEGAGKRPSIELPDQQDFERTMGYVERFFRRFMDMMRDFEKEEGPPPQKT